MPKRICEQTVILTNFRKSIAWCAFSWALFTCRPTTFPGCFWKSLRKTVLRHLLLPSFAAFSLLSYLPRTKSSLSNPSVATLFMSTISSSRPRLTSVCCFTDAVAFFTAFLFFFFTYTVHFFFRTQVSLGSDLGLGLCPPVSPRLCSDLTDVNLADEDTNSIPTDYVNGQSQAMWQCKWRHLVANIETNANWKKIKKVRKRVENKF